MIIDSPIPQASSTGFAKYIVEQKLLSTNEIQQIIKEADQQNITLIAHIINSKALQENILAHAVAKYFSLPYLDLDKHQPSDLPLDTLKPQLMLKYNILPLAQHDQQLQVAMADPTNTQTINIIKFHTSLNVIPHIVEHNKLKKLIEKFAQKQQYQQLENISTASDSQKDALITQFTDQIINDAFNQKASDIHFEPYEKYYRIRFRIDGILYEITKTDLSLAQRCNSRLKVMAKLDIAEKRLPQDGRFSLTANNGQTRDCRISTCPTMFGEKLVVRILTPSNVTLHIEQLGLETAQQKIFCEQIQKPQGMILITGPTGSGKTITLYTALTMLNSTQKNISTAEDPVEINLQGINQVEINGKIGLNFATSLRAFLRQDPDIIMIGEIRDLETAQIAIRAAQTGHLVLSTLHTNKAAESLIRLLNMGIQPFNLTTSITLIVAQRLVRKLCNHCKQIHNLPHTVLQNEGITCDKNRPTVIYKAHGCEHCKNGYQGRIGIFELLPISQNISQMLLNHCSSIDIEQQAQRDNILLLRAAALNKVLQGITSLEEINRVI